MTLQQIIQQKKWYFVNENLNDTNFPKPEKIQKEGHKIIKMGNSFSSEEALERIKQEGCRPANAWELAEFAVNHEDEMEQGKVYLAFGQTYRDSGGDHRMPRVYRYSGGDWEFSLGRFGLDWDVAHCLLAFEDTQALKESSSSLTLEKALEVVKAAGLEVYKKM